MNNTVWPSTPSLVRIAVECSGLRKLLNSTALPSIRFRAQTAVEFSGLGMLVNNIAWQSMSLFARNAVKYSILTELLHNIVLQFIPSRAVIAIKYFGPKMVSRNTIQLCTPFIALSAIGNSTSKEHSKIIKNLPDIATAMIASHTLSTGKRSPSTSNRSSMQPSSTVATATAILSVSRR